MTHRFGSVLCLGMLLCVAFAWSGCAPEGDVRLGREGESCFVDNDCEQSLVCARRACVPLGQTQTSGVSQEKLDVCESACDRIEECFEFGDDGCVEECLFSLRDDDEEEVDAFDSCLSSLSCRELERQGEECFDIIND